MKAQLYSSEELWPTVLFCCYDRRGNREPDVNWHRPQIAPVSWRELEGVELYVEASPHSRCCAESPETIGSKCLVIIVNVACSLSDNKMRLVCCVHIRFTIGITLIQRRACRGHIADFLEEFDRKKSTVASHRAPGR